MTDPPPADLEPETPLISRQSLLELSGLFLRLGVTAFGGPAAHIAMMQQEVVDRRKWLTQEAFLDLLGASSLIPGPSSTEVALHIGLRRAGYTGLAIAGVCFILPAALIVLALAWAYVRFEQAPELAAILYGVKPVVIAIIIMAMNSLVQTAAKSRWLISIGVIAAILAFVGFSPLIILIGSGSVVLCARYIQDQGREKPNLIVGLLVFVAILALSPVLIGRSEAAHSPPSTFPLFLVFLKLGSVVYGSGYVLLSFLRLDLVTSRHWLTSARLLDAVAAGQATPGPVFTTATFIGFILGGFRGAVVATVGIFLPGFILVAITGPFVARLRQSALASAFLDGVNIAALALMAAVIWQLAQDAFRDRLAVAVSLAAFLLLYRYKLNSAWLILGGAAFGLLMYGRVDRWHP